jgi:hypothetical protein
MTTNRMDAAWLHRRLTERGVVVLAVTPDGVEAEWLTVYLHGLGGNRQQERAFDFLIRLPGVIDVRVSDHTQSILLVRQRPDVPR